MAGLDNPIHLLFLLVLLLLVFGAKRLPEMGRSLGSGLRGFRDSLSADASQQPALEPSGAAARPSQPSALAAVAADARDAGPSAA